MQTLLYILLECIHNQMVMKLRVPKLLVQLSNWQLVKKDLTPQTYRRSSFSVAMNNVVSL